MVKKTDVALAAAAGLVAYRVISVGKKKSGETVGQYLVRLFGVKQSTSWQGYTTVSDQISGNYVKGFDGNPLNMSPTFGGLSFTLANNGPVPSVLDMIKGGYQ